MANSSSSSLSSCEIKVCYHCNSIASSLYMGWRLRNGGYCMLCSECACAYDTGRFCITFHKDASGWRNCVVCKTPIHCGCVMAAHEYNILDFGGVACVFCGEPDIEQYRSAISNVPETQQHVQDLSQVHLVFFPETGTRVSYVVHNERHIRMLAPGAPAHAVAPATEIGEQSHGKSPDGANLFHEGNMDSEPEENASGWIHLYPQNLPKTTSGQLQQTNIDSIPVLIPLFEKVLTSRDADPVRGMLFLPKLHAEAYFPEFPSDQTKMPLTVQDTTGIDWQFLYALWWNDNKKIFALEGFSGYMSLMGLRPGDKVTFFRVDPEKKLVIRLQKSPNNGSSRRA